jgi:hypothetical protein
MSTNVATLDIVKAVKKDVVVLQNIVLRLRDENDKLRRALADAKKTIDDLSIENAMLRITDSMKDLDQDTK